MTVRDINGALVTTIGGYPGEDLSDFDLPQLNKLGRELTKLEHGRTYPCPGGAGGGYDDIVSGAQVVIADGSGHIIATTELTGGTLTARGCAFDFTAKVPSVAFYQVTVTHRGALTFSLAELRRNDWRVDAIV